MRAATRAEHEAVETALDLLDPDLSRPRLAIALRLLHGFWAAAEAGLQAWADRSPDDARAVGWPRRRRAGLFAADLRALGGRAGGRPVLAEVADTDSALGRLYVLEGASLGGQAIDRHLAALPTLAAVRLHAFTPYGAETGGMWAAFRRAARERVAAGGVADAMIRSARGTFGALAGWCAPAARRPAALHPAALHPAAS
jgi:heme oxygenase